MADVVKGHAGSLFQDGVNLRGVYAVQGGAGVGGIVVKRFALTRESNSLSIHSSRSLIHANK
jgi:hypothetical protein